MRSISPNIATVFGSIKLKSVHFRAMSILPAAGSSSARSGRRHSKQSLANQTPVSRVPVCSVDIVKVALSLGAARVVLSVDSSVNDRFEGQRVLTRAYRADAEGMGTPRVVH